MEKAMESLSNKNFEEYKNMMHNADKTAELYKHECSLQYECKNFGMANYIFEDALPQLFKSNKQAVKEFIETIKGDNNLLKQFQFYKALESYNSSLSSLDFINESLNLFHQSVNSKTIGESNKKLDNIIKKYSIKPNDNINEDKIKFFENCDFLFKNKKKLSNLSIVSENINSIVNYINNNQKAIKETFENPLNLIEQFEDKYSKILSENERNLVKDIIDCKKECNKDKKEKLFNQFKNECLTIIDNLLKEANEDDLVGLNAIKDKITEKYFSESTLVKDIAHLLEIKDILNS
jgi:hypothetical protein